MVTFATGLLVFFWLTVIATLAWIFITAARSSLPPQPVRRPLVALAEPDTIAAAQDPGAAKHLRLRAVWSLPATRFEEHA
ncbi:MAG: hypothetical protein C4K60_11330 [Ideonella sp. MAG2]|nr:MAG: hypothetical protein C4K60_11330 [Ideonella sp. MAG2]